MSSAYLCWARRVRSLLLRGGEAVRPANERVTSRAHSTKRSTNGPIVRFLTITMATGHRVTGKSTGNSIRSCRSACRDNTELGIVSPPRASSDSSRWRCRPVRAQMIRSSLAVTRKPLSGSSWFMPTSVIRAHGLLTIGCADCIAATILRPIIERFFARHPRAALRTEMVPSPAINDPGCGTAGMISSLVGNRCRSTECPTT